jgi:hypothetical protein
VRPTDFAAQLNVSLANGWGIVRTVTDLCMKMPEGKYVLVKDPNKVRGLFPRLERDTAQTRWRLVDMSWHIGAVCVTCYTY